MSPEEKEEFEYMKERVAYFDQLIVDLFGNKPEALGQVVVSQVVEKSPTAARILRITTTQGEYNVLAE